MHRSWPEWDGFSREPSGAALVDLRPFFASISMAPGGVGSGVLGGGISNEELITHFAAADPDLIPAALSRYVVEMQADLAPDANGECTEFR